jgi:hypothetical protein
MGVNRIIQGLVVPWWSSIQKSESAEKNIPPSRYSLPHAAQQPAKQEQFRRNQMGMGQNLVPLCSHQNSWD